MKKTDKKALRDMTIADLQTKLNDLQMASANAQMAKSVNKLPDRKTVSKLRDDIARVKTVMTTKMEVIV